MFAAAAPPFGDLLGLGYLFGDALVGAVVPFGLLAGVVLLSRSRLRWGRSAATLVAVVFLCATVLGTIRLIVASTQGLLIGVASAVCVGFCGLALVVAASWPTNHPRVARIARWTPVIVALSVLLGAAGLIGFWLLDLPVQQIAVYQGVGPGNRDTFEFWYRSRNQAPMALSILAAGLGATAWRATGRLPAGFATAVGCVAISMNVVQLILQNAE